MGLPTALAEQDITISRRSAPGDDQGFEASFVCAASQKHTTIKKKLLAPSRNLTCGWKRSSSDAVRRNHRDVVGGVPIPAGALLDRFQRKQLLFSSMDPNVVPGQVFTATVR